MIRIALTKGRLEKKAAQMFSDLLIDTTSLEQKGRKLILPLSGGIEAVLAKAPDVLTYVECGVCDAGIVGKDTILEAGGSFYEVADLGFGKCRFALAARDADGFYKGHQKKRIATKYPNVATRYFAQKGMDVSIIKIEGSVELAPILGLTDAIVDIVETGDTLRENGLVVIDTIADISARLIINIAILKMKRESLGGLIEKIEAWRKQQ